MNMRAVCIVGVLLCVSMSVMLSPAGGQDAKTQPGEGKSEAPAITLTAKLDVLISIDENGSTLSFDWGDKKPALAVVKSSLMSENGTWWIVFDDSAISTVPNLKDNPVAGIKSIDVIPTKDSVVLQVVADSGLTPVVVHEGTKWQVTYKSHPSALSQKAQVKPPQSKEDGFVVGLEAPGKEVRFLDPNTGFVTVAFTTHQVGFGVDQDQMFSEFCLLATPQGIGFQLFKDDMTTQITSSQATLTHPDGLAVSGRQEGDQDRKCGLPAGIFTDAQDLDWASRRQKINEALLDLPHDQHAPGELEMAWLLLSYGQPQEAMGYLTHLAQERPSIIDLPLFQMLRGMGSLLLNQLPEAKSLLWPSRGEPEVQIWLSLIHALQQPHQIASSPLLLSKARSQFQSTKEMVKTYPKPLRSQIVTLILMAGIYLQDPEILKAFLDQEAPPENLSQKEVYELARARVLMSQSKPEAALQILGELMERASSAQVRAIARFDYVTHRLETKMMKEEDALPQLVTLRAQWHGGWLDHQVTAYLAKWRAGHG
jgi:hypothetical protein